MKRLFKIYIPAVLIIFGTSCSKNYFDINSNPNSATNTTPELVLPNALKVTVGTQLIGYNYLSGWMGYWAPSGSYAISASDVAAYKQTNDSYSGSWTTFYRNLEDYDYVEKTARAQNKPFYVGAAKIMKAFVFQQMTDMYNDLPYTDALKGTAVIQPKYDKGQAVYEAIAAQLDSGVNFMKNLSASALATSDIMFGGNTARWIAFANTVKLRILMRQSQMSGRASYIQAEIAKIVANGGGFLTVDATVNPGYAASAGQQNPTFGYFVTLTGQPTSGGSADYWRAAQYSISFLKNNNDIRYKFIYSVSGDTAHPYIGNVLGSLTNIPGTGTSSMGKGILKSVSQPAVMLSLAESYFLQAEANLRGWLGGSDNSNFQKGVLASFRYLGAFNDTIRIKSMVDPTKDSIVIPFTTDQSAAILVAQSGNKNTNYTACVNFNEKIACIIRQKWVAMNAITPFEAWSDYRRLALPADIPLSVSPVKDAPNIPVRILYPTSEYVTNATNVGAEGTIDGHTSKVFWMP